MKLKQHPDDFQVEERTAVQAGAEGAHAFYRLEKRGWSTPDALAVLRRRWKIAPNRLSYGGLKDRHAATIQYLSIFRGPRRNLHQQGIDVSYVGQIPHRYISRDITANRFRLTLREVRVEDRPLLEQRLAEAAAIGLPNYFDDQRFGSVSGPGGEFIGRLLVRGRFEEALRLALAAPYEYDRAAHKAEKRILTEHWGDWARCKDLLPRGHARSLVDYLRVHPGDFRGAVARLRPELRGLYLSAYQSHLWNRMLAHWLRKHCRAEQLHDVQLALGPAPLPHQLDPAQTEAFQSLQLPLPSARLRLEADDPLWPVVHAVLEEEGLTLRDLQVRGIRDLFFSRGDRAGCFVPASLTSGFSIDEKRPDRLVWVLAFELPRGAYATLVIKASTVATGATPPAPSGQEDDPEDF
jgi:tRNA pseudouridine13 synthase